MKKKLNILVNALLACAMCSITSCLSSDNDLVYYDDVAITNVQLGTLIDSLHTVSKSGADSIYAVTYSGSSYRMYIDQLKREIYNVDSLPLGTDLKRIVMTVTTTNNAIAAIIDKDIRKQITPSDTLDFTYDRLITVYATNAIDTTQYKMRLVAHQEAPDSFTWASPVTDEFIRDLDEVKALSVGRNIFVVGKKDGTTTLKTTPDSGEYSLSDVSLGAQLSQNTDAVSDGDSIYVLDHATSILYSSADGEQWNTYSSGANAGVKTLIGAVDGHIYGLSTANTIVMANACRTEWTTDRVNPDTYAWTSDDPMGEVMKHFPTENICSAVKKYGSKGQFHRLFVVGNRNESYGDTVASVWSRLYDTTTDDSEEWMYQPWGKEINYKLPRLDNLTITSYGDLLLAAGGDYGKIYVSFDQGITWITSSRVKMPAATDAAKLSIVGAKNNILWVFSTGSGKVMRGRLNGMTWDM